MNNSTKKSIAVVTSAHAVDDVRVYERMIKSMLGMFDIIWIGPDYKLSDKTKLQSDIKWYLHKKEASLLRRGLKLINAFRNNEMIKNVDFIYCPDPDSALISYIFKPSKKIRLIYDIHEVYHKYLLLHKVKGLLFKIASRFLHKLISFTASKMDLVVAVSDTVLNYYKKNVRKYYIIRNCTPKSELNQFNSKDSIKKVTFTVVHGKNHLTRGTINVLKALTLTKKAEVNCRVLMIDQYDSRVTDNEFNYYVNEYDVADQLEIHYNALPFREMQTHVLQSHAGLIAYGQDLGIDGLPNRLFEFMAAGIPVIIPKYAVEMVKIVEAERCGLIIDTENPKEIADAIQLLKNEPTSCEEMGQRGKKGFIERHNWEKEVQPLLQWIESN